MSDEILASGFQATPIGTLPSDWRCIQLRYIVPESRKVTYGIVQPGEHDSQGVLLIRGQDYIKGWAEPDAFFRVARPLHNVFKRSLTVAGDLLICIVGATTGATNVVPSWISEANITQTTARVACDSRKADSHFVLFALASELGQMQVRKYVKGSAQPGLNLADVERFYVAAAPLSEQRKIARILTTVDNLIEKTEALIAKYQAIKQGMMHDLFTRGVDEHGHLRPPYEEAPELYKQSELGWIPKEWRIEDLRNVVDFWDGKRIPLKQEDRDLMEGEFPYYGASGIIDYVDRYLFDDELILLGEDGENVVSRNLPLAFRVSGRCWVNNHAHVLKPLDGVDIDFLTEYLESLDYSGIASGSAQPKITQKHLAKTKVTLPSLTEQRQITARLSNLAAKLRIEQESAAKFRLQKTGLMQDLLTGKVRVKVDEAEEVSHL
jgi:restriction endonuclease S subunit